MKIYKGLIVALLAGILLTFTSCNSEISEDEIKIPIYNNETNYKTMTVETMDLSATATSGASFGYVFAENQYTTNSANLISMSGALYSNVKQGDIIAQFDSSEYDYALLEKQIKLEAAQEAYNATGTETDKLAYEQAAAELAAIQNTIDSYTLRAPYDGVITSIARIETGSEVKAGTFVYSIAKPDDAYVYLNDNDGMFKLGETVDLKFTASTYQGKVVSVPSGNNTNNNNNWGGNKNNDAAASPNTVSADTNVFIGIDSDTLGKILEETPNAITAGWATVIYPTDQMYNVVAVPQNAVKLFSGSTYVYQYENGQRLQTPVEAGQTINGYTVILSGLHEGDEIITE